MSNLDWQTSDGVTLKSLRQSAGIGLSVLAKKASLSVEQLKQLEEGGSSLFYTEAIKLRAGERVLSILGFRFTEPQATPLVQGNPANRIIPVKSQTPTLLGYVFLAKDVLSKKFVTVFGRITLFTELRKGFALGQSASMTSLWHSSTLWVVTGTLASMLLCYDLYLQVVQRGWSLGVLTTLVQSGGTKALPTPSNEGSVTSLTIDASVQVDKASSANANAQGTKGASVSGERSDLRPDVGSSSSTETPANANSNTPTCHWQSDSPSLSVLHPSKLGNFVHITAVTATHLCIMDSHDKVSVLSLVAGSSQSFYGVAPFKIYSENLKQLRFYFQGYGVYMPPEVGFQFTLTELPLTKAASVAQTAN